jgi:S-adenosylmethionine-diacylglycerol 3-amino-3-carboxypropyl transferase
MSFLFDFGFSQEDEITASAALDVDGQTVLCIASAGDIPLSLLALGARKIVAVDISEPQLHLCRLKAAAIQCLERDAAAGLLGFTSASESERLRWLGQCIARLPGASAEFWRLHERVLCSRGAIWCGRYEQFIRKLLLIIRPLLGGAFDDLARCSTCAEQQALFDRRIGRAWLRAFFRLAFNPGIFSRYGIDRQSLAHRQSAIPLGEQYWAKLRSFCSDTPAVLNPWLQIHTMGRLLSLDAAPYYLTAEGFAKTRQEMDRLRWVHCDLHAYVRDQLPVETSRVYLSNLPDWSGAADFEQLICDLARKLAPQSRVVWCYLHVNPQLPGCLSGSVSIDDSVVLRRRERDRFPFYTYACARIAGASSSVDFGREHGPLQP